MIPIKVSVIIPVYNLVPYLRRCLDSVIGQTLKDIEIICINDGSTDGSPAILREYERADSRVRVVDQENGGPGIARNTGIDMAKGEYVGFVDGDDWIDARMYETMYKVAKKNDSDLVLCTVSRLDTDGNELGIQCNYDRYLTDRFNDDAVFSRTDIADALFKLERFSMNKIYRRNFIQDRHIRFSSHRCYEDNIFHFRSIFEATRISVVSIPFYKYIFNREGASSSKTKKVEALFDVNREIKAYVDSIPLENELLKRFDNYKVRRYLSYYYIVGQNSRKSFFSRMKAEFQALPVKGNPYINGFEKIFCLLVCALPYTLFRCTHIPGYICFYLYMRWWLRKRKVDPLDVV